MDAMRDGDVHVHFNLTEHGERVSSCGFDASIGVWPLPIHGCAPGYAVWFTVETDGTTCRFLMECQLPSGAGHTVEATIPVNLRKRKQRVFKVSDELVLSIGAAIKPTEENSKWLRKIHRKGTRRRAESGDVSHAGGVVYQILRDRRETNKGPKDSD